MPLYMQQRVFLLPDFYVLHSYPILKSIVTSFYKAYYYKLYFYALVL